ncbi:MAG: response regulator [Hyphomonas sp.]|uniref:chemotaxis protein CheB n=1 Tax=Hyphomonas sp. TaxID=87 RepID=UPI0017AFEC6E|nr:chemotaxis protein CheB [Hyphomonas sp.]MBA3067554.1 response regulator [Hyphomonas sp.]MBU4063443.1 response regulator [Alphaproteobacteria bacterium]MBU4165264.1 response regulator [Alphaproteobacteria bacterium]
MANTVSLSPKTGPAKERNAIPVVGIGASAGGLQAFKQFLQAVPEKAGMAFVLIQHLSPDHESLMASILGARTDMVVRQIDHQMRIERDCVYINAPGQDVSLSGNTLLVRHQPAGRLTWLPFDYFLASLAKEREAHAMCVVLSGTGTDGTKGLKLVKQAGGLVIAQDPKDSEADGMPKSAIETGAVDDVLPAAQIAAALMKWNGRAGKNSHAIEAPPQETPPDWLNKIIERLHEQTGTDFSLYKTGTLIRRITRRMSLLSAAAPYAEDYLKLLASSPVECEALAADLLINVTRFFRDPEVFSLLEESVLPELISNHSADRPFRVWVAGCSSGEEVWSLGMLLREAIDADGRNLRLQILASDIDTDAIETARRGFYPASISADVSPERLARFFVPEERGYRIRETLRAQAVFTVQNLLSDPPFARLDLVSCRNVMIYLGPEAQARMMSHFQFSLSPGGILLLGTSETAGDITRRFEVVSKTARVYRRLGGSFPISPDGQPSIAGDTDAPPFLLDLDPIPDDRFADVCRRAVARHYTPASVLVTRQRNCLHFLGHVDQFLEVPEGTASLDIVPMVPVSQRAALRDAIAGVGPQRELIQLPGLTTRLSGQAERFTTEVRYAPDDAEELVLITFLKQPTPDVSIGPVPDAAIPDESLQLTEIAGLRQELEHIGRRLEQAQETERKTRRESLRLNEEYQSTNEELVTSKEELQSLNEELMVLNSQLQETVERQRTTSNDLTNVLYSTNVATLFLDSRLRIRFFTPATKIVFGVIATDVGRPLADLRSLALDKYLLHDAEMVLESKDPIEREIETPDGLWFLRRILPYRTHTNEVEGVVITYIDVQEQHRATESLKSAIRQAEHAVITKTRFLASASHDLRQPLQTLTLVHDLLAREAYHASAVQLIKQMEQAINAMSGMLNTMLDINQIEAGVISYQFEDVPVSVIMSGLYTEFVYHAEAKSLGLRMAPCSAVIRTDRRLLEQMMRNLLSNAIRYTDSGRILIGCRRARNKLRIEIWDTGIGISETDLPKVFGEYHKVSSGARVATEGLGLGLSIVQRLADLLGHRIHVRSSPGSGSMFSIEIDLATAIQTPGDSAVPASADRGKEVRPNLTAKVLVTEDESDVRQLLDMLLTQSGHTVTTAATLEAAAASASDPAAYPDLLIADYNLTGGHTGIELGRLLRQHTNASLPVIILTGDISAATRTLIAKEGFSQLNKPVSREPLENEIERLLQLAKAPAGAPHLSNGSAAENPQVIVVDDDLYFCNTLTQLLQQDGLRAISYPSGEAFLADLPLYTSHNKPVCVLIDAYLGGLSGFDVLDALPKTGTAISAIMITGNSDVNLAVQAMKAGALNFIEKPIDAVSLRAAIDQALAVGRDAAAEQLSRAEAIEKLAKLTPREREVLDLVLTGEPNKNIAADLGISQRTVESHRAAVMQKSGCKSLPALVRLVVRAS